MLAALCGLNQIITRILTKSSYNLVAIKCLTTQDVSASIRKLGWYHGRIKCMCQAIVVVVTRCSTPSMQLDI